MSVSRIGMMASALGLSSALLRAEAPLPPLSVESSSASAASVRLSTEAVSLQPMTERSTGPVVVTLTRTPFPASRLPTTVEVLTPAQLHLHNPQNVGELLARATSLQVRPIGRLGAPLTAGLRGFSSEQVLVLLDGRPLSGAFLSSPDLAEQPVENVDRIEILRGGASALYGPNAMGGVINILTRRSTYPGRPVSHASYESRSYGNQIYRLNFGSRARWFDYFFYGDNGWESGFRDNSDNRAHHLGGNFGISMGRAGKLSADAGLYHISGGVPGRDRDLKLPIQFNDKDEKLASAPTARQTIDSRFFRTSYMVPLSSRSFITLRVHGSQRQAEYKNPSSSTTVTTSIDPATGLSTQTSVTSSFLSSSTLKDEQSRGGEIQLNLPAGVVLGGSFLRDRLDDTDRLNIANSMIRSAELWGVYAQKEFSWKQASLIPSGRYDHHSVAGESKNPRVQLIVDATPGLRLSASAARSFRAPTLEELYRSTAPFVGNPRLHPEKAWSYDAGFELHRGSQSFRATYFLSQVADLIQPTSEGMSRTNVGRARRQGMELQIRHTLNPRIRQEVNYAYLQNIGLPAGFSDPVDLANSPRHAVNYVFTLTPARRWRVDSTLRYLDSRFSGNNRSGTKLSSYLVWGLRLSYQLGQMDCYLGVNNLTHKRYEEVAGYPLPGRTAYGGFLLRLWD